jgi:hypothetical protein
MNSWRGFFDSKRVRAFWKLAWQPGRSVGVVDGLVFPFDGGFEVAAFGIGTGQVMQYFAALASPSLGKARLRVSRPACCRENLDRGGAENESATCPQQEGRDNQHGSAAHDECSSKHLSSRARHEQCRPLKTLACDRDPGKLSLGAGSLLREN